jgi:hypothetical protein
VAFVPIDCGLFNDTVSSSYYTASDDRMINELKRIWKKAVVTYFNPFTPRKFYLDMLETPGKFLVICSASFKTHQKLIFLVSCLKKITLMN